MNLVRAAPHKLQTRKKSHGMIDDLDDVDFFLKRPFSALDLWDLIVSVLGNMTQTAERGDPLSKSKIKDLKEEPMC